MARTTLNFSDGRTESEVVALNDNTKSVWVSALHDLAAGLAAGKGEYDHFYKLGEFANPTGARTAVRNVEKAVEAGKVTLPGEFDLRPVIVTTDEQDDKGKAVRKSELWAAMVDPEASEADEDSDDADVDAKSKNRKSGKSDASVAA